LLHTCLYKSELISQLMSEKQPPLVPPEEGLSVPAGTPIYTENQSWWVVVARNSRINKDWEKLIKQSPENARRCYERLREDPMQRSPGRIFPLKGKQYRGAWECELTGGDRIFYVPDPETRKVVVYYAGPHPKKAPTPP
jgi:hypothetical protein